MKFGDFLAATRGEMLVILSDEVTVLAASIGGVTLSVYVINADNTVSPTHYIHTHQDLTDIDDLETAFNTYLQRDDEDDEDDATSFGGGCGWRSLEDASLDELDYEF